MRDATEDVDVDVVEERGGVVEEEAADDLYPDRGELGVMEEDVQEVIVVYSIKGLADVEEGPVERRIIVPFLEELAEVEEEGLLVTVAAGAETSLAVVGGPGFLVGFKDLQ